MHKVKNIVVYVMNFPDGATTISQLREYETAFGGPLRIMLLRDDRITTKKHYGETPGLDLYVECDFSKPHRIAAALLPYQDELLAITCRSEQ